jgi:hypothetical protein
MNKRKFSIVFLLVLVYATNFAQLKIRVVTDKQHTVRSLTIDPGIGFHTNFGSDLLLSTLVQWNPLKYLSLATHSSFAFNNILQRNFNGINTGYNYSILQKFGAGTTLYSKRSSHTFLLMAGMKYTSFRETMKNQDNLPVRASIQSFSPDYGWMYALRKGVKNRFFVFRMYVPLYPWPIKGSSISYADGNMNNIALELGLGLKIK